MNTRKATLTPRRKQLVELMQRMNFGTIEKLIVQNGDPIFNPAPVVTRQVKFGASNQARPESSLTDFALRNPVRELFAQMEAMGDGVIRCIEVKHGLPFKMTVEEDAA